MAINQPFKNAINQVKFQEGLKQAEVAKKLGVSNTYLSDMINGRVPFTDNISDKLYELFHIRTTAKNNTSELKSISDQILGSELIISEETTATMVPLLPLSAQGGSLNDFVVSVKDSDCEKIVSPIKGADFAMPVAGDSMAPEYPAGSQIFIKKINERAFIDWGKVYVLDTCNGSVIKKLFPADDKNPGKIKCVSINPDYPPFEVSLEDVFGVYRVMLCMAIK